MYEDLDFVHLLKLASFWILLVYLTGRAKVLEEVEKQMLESISYVYVPMAN